MVLVVYRFWSAYAITTLLLKWRASPSEYLKQVPCKTDKTETV
jgi:hypothetical protein